MIDLAQRSEPYEIALPYGLSATVKPLTTAGMSAAQAAARRAVEAIERQARERREAGLILDGLPELSAEGERVFQEFTLRQVLLNAAKNGSGPSAAGTFSRAEGPSTAEPAETTTCPAPEASLEPTGASAPTASTP
jgi:hypothetical protein